MKPEQSRLRAQDRREQILAVAMELFARQGFKGTTTRQIAQGAEVNEAIIFRHFPRKEDLYWAIIEAKCRAAGKRAELRSKLQASTKDREVFTAIAEDILQRNLQDDTLTRLLLFSALENHRLSHRFFRTYVADYYEVLADHVRRRIREGRFRPLDPLLAARGFLGMIVYHFLIQELFGGKQHREFDPSEVAKTLTDIWLKGVQAERKQPARPRKSSKSR